MASLLNTLPEVMGRHRIKQAALFEAAGQRYATVNALYNGKTQRVDFKTLAAVLEGVNTLTASSTPWPICSGMFRATARTSRQPVCRRQVNLKPTLC